MGRDAGAIARAHLVDAGVAELPPNWDVVTLGDLFTEDRGIAVGVMYPGEHVVDGVPLIKAGDLNGSTISPRPAFRISSEKHHEYRRTALEGGELLMTLVGNVGQCAIVPPRMAGWNVARAVAVMRFADPTDARFVQQCLLSRPLQHLMDVWCNTTVQATLNLKEIRQLPLPWPPKKSRDAIAAFGQALDDKIEVNRRMNETLEAMARALFKSWFEEQAEADRLDEKPVSDLGADGVLQVGDGYRAKNDEMANEGLPFARAGNIDNGFDFDGADLLGLPGVGKAGDKISRACDVVFTSKGTVGRFGFVDPAMRPFVYSPQLCFWRSTNHEALNPFVLRQWMASRWFLDQVDRVKGQTDMAEYVSLRDQRAMRFPLATPESQADIGAQLAELQRLVWNNGRETHTLARIRDGLLPRLLSGELLVDTAERVVEANA